MLIFKVCFAIFQHYEKRVKEARRFEVCMTFKWIPYVYRLELKIGDHLPTIKAN